MAREEAAQLGLCHTGQGLPAGLSDHAFNADSDPRSGLLQVPANPVGAAAGLWQNHSVPRLRTAGTDDGDLAGGLSGVPPVVSGPATTVRIEPRLPALPPRFPFIA